MRGLPSIGLGVLVSVLLAAPVFGENSFPPPSEGAVASVWKLQKVEFHYFGRTSRYSLLQSIKEGEGQGESPRLR